MHINAAICASPPRGPDVQVYEDMNFSLPIDGGEPGRLCCCLSRCGLADKEARKQSNSLAYPRAANSQMFLALDLAQDA